MHPVVRGLLKSIPLVIYLALCVAIAGRLEAAIPIGGAFVTLGVVVMLVLTGSTVWAYAIPWSRMEYLVSFLPVPVVVLFIVASFSGFTGMEILHEFNLIWVAQVTVGLAVPWFLGLFLGSRLKARRVRA